MLIRHLDYFVTLAEEQHFGRAAALCGVSQPALSLAIRKLEEDMGATLILRGKRFMGLTPEGEKVLARGRMILADYGHLRDDLSGRRKGGLTGSLRLGVTPAAMALAPMVSAAFEARNPMARISLRPMAAEDVTTGLRHHSLDGGLVWAEKRQATDLSFQRLHGGRAVFACPADHPFAPDPEVAWRDAETQPLCLTEDLADALLRLRGVKAAVSCGSLDAVLAHLRAGLWCAILPESFARLLAPGDPIVLRPMEEDAELVAGIMVLNRSPVAPMVQALLECLPQEAACDGAPEMAAP